MNLFNEIEFNSWDETKKFLSSKDSSWCFRGQANYNWELKTSIDRVDESVRELREYKKEFEGYMIREYKRNIEFHFNNPYLTQTDFQIISLMQHHGAPTRLLDFTESPYVATFFAMDKCEANCAIFAINYMELLSATRILFQSQWDDNSDEINAYKYSGSMSSDNIFDLIVLGSRQFKFVEFVQPFSYFERLIKQQGVFLCQGDISVNFETNLHSNFIISKELGFSPMYKIKLDSGWRLEVLKDLNRMNINSSTLFPGVEGFFKSLKNSFDFSASDRLKYITEDYLKNSNN